MGGQIVSIYREPDIRFFADEYERYKSEIERINKSLIERKLPLYEATEAAIPMPINPEFLLELRRSEARRFKLLAAKFIKNSNWVLPSDQKDYDPISDIEYQQICRDRKSHIAGMPDVHGYYVPVSFNSLSFPPYPILGSSITFQSELREMALKLNFNLLELDSYASNPRMPENTRIEELRKEVFGEDKGVLLSLYAIATASVCYRRIIYLGE
jgi:hypothetical protein